MFNSIAIIGAGAVGGYYGGRLAQHGHDLHFLLRSDYEAWRTHGLKIQSIDGDFFLSPQQLHVYNHPTWMPKVDLVIITLKTTENRRLGELVSPLLHENTAILTLQNGLGNEQHLAALFGAQRVVGGLAFTCINRIVAGVIHHSDYGHIKVGEFQPPGRSARAEGIAAMFNAAKVRAAVADDLALARWDKQVWNVPFNGLGALLDLTTDRLITSDAGVSLVRKIMAEVMTAAADGVLLPPDTPEQKIALTRTMGPYLTSTQVDRRLGKPLEIDAIFAQPVRIAHHAGQSVPLLELLEFSLRQLDAQKGR